MFIVGGVRSGVGKTVLTLGLMEALRLRGLSVAPFKAGPDYIDPALHGRVLGAPSYNLDTWMMGEAGVRETFTSRSAGADVSVVEGVMGLYDGKGGKAVSGRLIARNHVGRLGGTSVPGSTAHLAKTLGLPVLLVVDSSSMAQSAAALIKGFCDYDPDLKVMGVVFNRVSSERHAEILADAARTVGVRVFGFVGRDDKLKFPSRHLGLVSAGEIEARRWRGFLRGAARAVESNLDIDALLKASKRGRKGKARAFNPSGKESGASLKVAVAMDKAFSFYYHENLDILASLGAKLLYFSPISDVSLPEGTDALYLGGGYPELFSEELSANRSMREQIKNFSREGGPVFAECGGLLYLGRTLKTIDGREHDMAGVFPFRARMEERRTALAYREVRAGEGSFFLRKGAKIRGHEFHYSSISGAGCTARVFEVDGGGAGTGVREGFLRKNTLATYIHLHFASNPAFARGFISASRKSMKKFKK